MSGDETEFSSDSYYEEKGSSIEAWHQDWTAFERSLKTEARFFSQAAAKHLVSVFGDIETMRGIATTDWTGTISPKLNVSDHRRTCALRRLQTALRPAFGISIQTS
ncbi:hypothetical protein [Bosea vaviloviae]|uniref:hypothetical protein n=1 Tax=Bosea vaviloviae TaxID=1526658 RepID=UPI0006BA8FE7|nr:hypothetical protein [Bosea vaviloviae]